MESKAAILERAVASPDFSDSRAARIETVDVDSPGPSEVVVEVRAASLCHTDNAIALGYIDQQYPLVMGHEGAGVVHEVGDGVEGLAAGDHVVLGRIACGTCAYCRGGRSQLCTERMSATRHSTLRDGAVRFRRRGEPAYHCHGVSAFSEYTVVNEEVAIPITREVPLEQATLLGCGIFTGVGAVTNTADVAAGSSVAIFGLGGVGLSAVQGAALRGAGEIIGIDVVADKRDLATTLGADRTLDGARADLVEAIHDITDGGVDYAVDAVGSPAVTEHVLDVLRPDGTAVVVGIPPAGKHDLPVDIHSLVRTEKRLVGSFNGSYNLSIAIPRLAEMVADGDLQLAPLISDTRSLDELNDAMDDLEHGTAIRQVILPE